MQSSIWLDYGRRLDGRDGGGRNSHLTERIRRGRVCTSRLAGDCDPLIGSDLGTRVKVKTGVNDVGQWKSIVTESCTDVKVAVAVADIVGVERVGNRGTEC